MTEIVKEYKEHQIKVGEDTHMRFRVTGPLIDDWFGEYHHAITKIDEAAAKHETQNRKRIAIAVLDETGERQTVKGVHAGNGSILGFSAKRWTSAYYYPENPWIADTLKQIKRLHKETERLENVLRPLAMHQSGNDLRTKTHAEKVDELVKMIEAKTKIAEQMIASVSPPEAA